MWTIEAQSASHAGLNPEAGASAILELARQTERLHSLSDRAGNTSFNVGIVRGGTRSNVVAAQAEIEVDVRFGTAKRLAAWKILSTLQPFDERVQLKVKGGINRGSTRAYSRRREAFNHAHEIARFWDLISASFR
jgi:glutamate carboxypeptidase